MAEGGNGKRQMYDISKRLSDVHLDDMEEDDNYV